MSNNKEWDELRKNKINEVIQMCGEYGYPTNEKEMCVLIDNILDAAELAFKGRIVEFQEQNRELAEKMEKLLNDIPEFTVQNNARAYVEAREVLRKHNLLEDQG